METQETIFEGKTSAEAIEIGLKSLGITLDQAEIEVLEEGRKKLFSSVKARVKVTVKCSDGLRAVKFLDELLNHLNINATADLVSEDDKIEINISTSDSHAVIGRRGETLDALQCITGAVANIGNEEYKRVSVDCENYRAQREQTLIDLANKLAKKAVEKGRKVTLEPMTPYERRIIHAALINSTEVKTISEGKEPNRYVVIIPNNMKPYERKPRSEGDNKERRHDGHTPRREGDRRDGHSSHHGDRRDRPSSPRPSAPRGKKQINLGGTFLGNSGNKFDETGNATVKSESTPHTETENQN